MERLKNKKADVYIAYWGQIAHAKVEDLGRTTVFAEVKVFTVFINAALYAARVRENVRNVANATTKADSIT